MKEAGRPFSVNVGPGEGSLLLAGTRPLLLFPGVSPWSCFPKKKPWSGGCSCLTFMVLIAKVLD